MIHGNTVSFAVTAYQEMAPEREQGQRLLACIQPAIADDRIDEIVIVDDASDDYDDLAALVGLLPKVALYRNINNLGVWGNKIEAVLRSTADWVINCDSDNRMGASYFDAVEKLPFDPEVRYSPSKAEPMFDYTSLVGLYDTGNILCILDEPLFECAMNTGNQIMHRNTFEDVFATYRRRPPQEALPNFLGVNPDRLANEGGYWRAVYNACDSFMFNLVWMLDGHAVEIARCLTYQHHYTNSDTSNYARAPAEKCDLSRAMKEYLRKVAGNVQSVELSQ